MKPGKGGENNFVSILSDYMGKSKVGGANARLWPRDGHPMAPNPEVLSN